MRNFKKLAVLAITIPTLLSSTNISFAMKSPKQCKSTKKQNKKFKQDKTIRDGLGGFQCSIDFMGQKMENLSRFKKPPSREIFEKLTNSYGHANACVVTCLNYIRSCIITLKLNKDGGATIKGRNGNKNIFNNTEEIVNRILETLTTTLESIKETEKQKNAWASIKYVVKQIHEGVQLKYINPMKVSKKDKHLYEFICRGINRYRFKRNFNINLMKTLFDKLSFDNDYKDRGDGGDDSFGKRAFENALEVCTTNGSLPDFTTYSPANVYDPITSQEQEQPIYISLNQLSLDGQGSVLFNQNAPYDITSGVITIQNAFTTTNIPNIYIVNSLFHDENGYLFTENGTLIYNKGQPVQLPLPQQQYCHDTVDNLLFKQEEIDEQVEDNAQEKSPKSPECQIKKGIMKQKNRSNEKPETTPKCPLCKMNDDVVRNGHNEIQ